MLVVAYGSGLLAPVCLLQDVELLLELEWNWKVLRFLLGTNKCGKLKQTAANKS